MTGKHFSLNNDAMYNLGILRSVGVRIESIIYLIEDNSAEKLLKPSEVVDLLNSLNDENEQLRHKYEVLSAFYDSDSQADEKYDVYDDFVTIRELFDFFIENNFEQECIEYERESRYIKLRKD